MSQDPPIALIDLDGSVADMSTALITNLNRMRSPNEMVVFPEDLENPPEWMDARMDYIKQHPGFWQNLERIPEGFLVLDLMRQFGFSLNVLSKGPRKAINAWTEKAIWCQQHIPDAGVQVVTSKQHTYGRVLFDDYPQYIEQWLKYRPRGTVLMLDQPWNQHFKHPNVVRVGKGSTWHMTLPIVTEALYQAANR